MHRSVQLKIKAPNLAPNKSLQMWKCVALAAVFGALQPWCPAAETTVEPVVAFATVLSSADLLNATGTQQALRELGLLAVPDILRLDAAESTEMVSSLRGAGVTLGDRSRLRELVDSHRARTSARLSDPAASTDGWQAAAPRSARALQEAKAESSLSISGCVSALSCQAA
jgi:hypothetical protein